MARLWSRLKTLRREMRGGLFVVLAMLLFGGTVFLLFRGHSSGPQEAAARETPPALVPTASGERTAPAPVVEVPPVPAPTFGPTPVVPLEATPAPAAAADANATPVAVGKAVDPQVEAAIGEALKLARSQPTEVIRVRDELNKLLQGPATPEQRQRIKDELTKLSQDWLFGPAAFPGDKLCDTYTVKRGDLLDIIGRRLKVPYEILMQINNIARPQAVQAGRPLKVVHGPFHVKVNRATFTMDLYLQDMYVHSFKVGLGAPGTETPTGLWRVKDGGKLIQPPWYDKRTNRTYKASDPDYPLGTRWIALDGLEGDAKGRTGFAIHGTKDPDQIGTAASQGCIRMHNADVELMYKLLIPIYSQVEVVDESKG